MRLPADLAPGAYRVVLEAGGSRSSIVALLTTQRLVAKLAAAQLLVWATDATGRPAADLPLTVYGAAGKVLARVVRLAPRAASRPLAAPLGPSELQELPMVVLAAAPP